MNIKNVSFNDGYHTYKGQRFYTGFLDNLGAVVTGSLIPLLHIFSVGDSSHLYIPIAIVFFNVVNNISTKIQIRNIIFKKRQPKKILQSQFAINNFINKYRNIGWNKLLFVIGLISSNPLLMASSIAIYLSCNESDNNTNWFKIDQQ
ncbi:hypothetical protein OAR19_00325 [bacterium]|nr:hypothetical protein [bacterium]